MCRLWFLFIDLILLFTRRLTCLTRHLFARVRACACTWDSSLPECCSVLWWSRKGKRSVKLRWIQMTSEGVKSFRNFSIRTPARSVVFIFTRKHGALSELQSQSQFHLIWNLVHHLCWDPPLPVSHLVFFCVRALNRCEQMIQRYSRELSSDSSAVGKAVEDCMKAVIGVLLNLTHDNG